MVTNRVTGFSYDAAGNVTDDNTNTYTYDANNQITSVNSGAVTFKYDASGQRVAKITASKTTYYVLGMGEYDPNTATWDKLFVSLGAEKLVQYSNGTTEHSRGRFFWIRGKGMYG